MEEYYLPTLATNSNGTYVCDLYRELPHFFEGMEKPQRLREGERVVNETDEYHPSVINGFDNLFGEMRWRRRKLVVISNASTDSLDKINGQLGLDDLVENFGLFDRQTDIKQDKDRRALMEISRQVQMQDGQMPVAYISHKQAEAELGAEVYGVGILVDPDCEQPYQYQYKGGKVVVVSNMREFYVNVLMEFLLDADIVGDDGSENQQESVDASSKDQDGNLDTCSKEDESDESGSDRRECDDSGSQEEAVAE